ncbi:MAG TPA: hypothetical protein VND19_15835 [Acetobacteraceae bacterium]|nr:hypothetical protein [Acetobacteraceae bacterium]
MSDPYLLPLARAAAATYVPSAVCWLQNDTRTCQVFRSVVAGHPCFAFGGTQTFREWLVDFLALEVPCFQHADAGPIHLGFYLDIRSAIDAMCVELASLGWPSFLVAGHSKGAGEAVLAHMELKARGHAPLATRAYEPPMVGTAALTRYLAGDDIGWTQTANRAGPDIVTLVPDWPEWEHQGVLMRLLVPDAYGIAQKHEVAAVLVALVA